jgi:hypothetical protein
MLPLLPLPLLPLQVVGPATTIGELVDSNQRAVFLFYDEWKTPTGYQMGSKVTKQQPGKVVCLFLERALVQRPLSFFFLFGEFHVGTVAKTKLAWPTGGDARHTALERSRGPLRWYLSPPQSE